MEKERFYPLEQFKKDQESSKRAQPIFEQWWLPTNPTNHMYKLTASAHTILSNLGYEWNNWLTVFDSSPKWFVIWLGMSKDEAIEKWIIEKIPPNPLHDLCTRNWIIPHEWIQKNLSEEQYKIFMSWIAWQWQSEYGVWSTDVVRFLKREWL
jgi:hypothetical protein